MSCPLTQWTGEASPVRGGEGERPRQPGANDRDKRSSQRGAAGCKHRGGQKDREMLQLQEWAMLCEDKDLQQLWEDGSPGHRVPRTTWTWSGVLHKEIFRSLGQIFPKNPTLSPTNQAKVLGNLPWQGRPWRTKGKPW